MTNDFLFRGELSELDPDVSELIRHETARQQRTLIMIPSSSTMPLAVHEAVGSAFAHIYAEGYPLEETRRMTQQQILDYETRLPEYRRIADNRYYKGTEYANILEALTRRRCAELFANERVKADDLFVNVQLPDAASMERTDAVCKQVEAILELKLYRLARLEILLIQNELTDIPLFRTQYGYSSFSEGWGLYAEELGKEMGFFTDPYND
ncbi:DUF885 family protein, partial [bacterium]|nr:DUF885 family protein [bacterium]